MSTFDRVKGAKSPQDALAAVAHALDNITGRLTKIEEALGKVEPQAGWGEWDASPPEDDAPLVTGAEATSDELKAAAVVKIRTITEKLEGADGEDRQSLEAALRLAQDDLARLRASTDLPDPSASVVEVKGGEVIVNLPPPSEHKKDMRIKFAKAIQMAESLPMVPDAVATYAKAGPLWLYYGNREYVMELPDEAKHVLVADVHEDDTIEAQLMSRDILKDTEAEGHESVLHRVYG